MTLHYSLRTINFAVTALLILCMCNQIGFDLPLSKGAVLPISVADVVLGLAALGVVLQIVRQRGRGFRLPPLQAVALVAVACAAAARSGAKLEAAKEVLQLTEYFLVAFVVFLNAAETGDLKPFLAAFAVATGIVVLWAALHYATSESAFAVRAGFKNRNALGAFLALSLPVLYGVALYARCWGLRLALLAIVALGLLVNLSGGAVLVTLVVLGIQSALRGQRTLMVYVVAVGVALVALPGRLPRRHHTDALFASVAPFVSDNFLLGDDQLFARAKGLCQDARKSMEQSTQENPREVQPPREFFDAKNLMEFLRKRRGGDRGLTDEQRKLYYELLAETAKAAETFPNAAAASALSESQLAVRYQRWHAAIACSRTLWDSPSRALLGLGFVDYHAAIDPFRPRAKLQYRSDEPEVFNVATSEPFTHDIWLRALVQTGLLGLLAQGWLIAAFLGRALRLHGAAHSELMLGVALGLVGGILGFALGGIFTETIARGLALPFVFLCSLVAIGERIVHGDTKPDVERITPYDWEKKAARNGNTGD